MASMNDVISMDRIPAMPAAVVRLMPLLADPEADWTSLEKVIRQDEALTVTILRLANSAMFGSPGKHFDLRRAMTRLGREGVRQCVLEQVASLVSGENAAFGLQRDAMWRSSLGGAIAAEDLARKHDLPDVSLAFMCGLLRDIGQLALNVKYGAEYLRLIEANVREDRSFIDSERRTLGFDHAQVGAALARRWRLPERIAAAIEHHHNPPPPGPDHDILFDVVHAADTICRWAGLGVGVDGMRYTLADHVREGMKLDRRSAEREIALVWDSLREAEESLVGTGNQGAAA